MCTVYLAHTASQVYIYHQAVHVTSGAWLCDSVSIIIRWMIKMALTVIATCSESLYSVIHLGVSTTNVHRYSVHINVVKGVAIVICYT